MSTSRRASALSEAVAAGVPQHQLPPAAPAEVDEVLQALLRKKSATLYEEVVALRLLASAPLGFVRGAYEGDDIVGYATLRALKAQRQGTLKLLL